MGKEAMVTEYKEDFRSSLSTVDRSGHRRWVFPKKPSGRYYKWRSLVSYLLLAIMVAMPLIRVNGHPFFMLNVFERKFILFGQIFWPSDFYIVLTGVLAFILFIILFTVIFGRLWCGWACPQTIFMEMVFRKIEYWIEGDAIKQKKLSRQPWNTEKLIKRGAKHGIFFIISFFIANLLLAYLVGTDRLAEIITSPPTENLAGFIAVMGFSGIFFWIYAYFREQVCTIVCPYGRLQSVLLDRKSTVVSYDYVRGEPRAKNTRLRPQEAGDCIDCGQCVDVCPTGIDIRNGIQLECISCAACIDACDFVMTKVNKPTGLIRHSSEENIEKGTQWKVTPRIIGYSAILTVLLGLLSFMIVTKKDINLNLTRVSGSLYMETPEGEIRNLYQLRVTNKTYETMPLNLRLKDAEGEIIINGDSLVVPSEKYVETLVFVDIPKEKIHDANAEITLEVFTGDRKLDQVKTHFFAPPNF